MVQQVWWWVLGQVRVARRPSLRGRRGRIPTRLSGPATPTWSASTHHPLTLRSFRMLLQHTAIHEPAFLSLIVGPSLSVCGQIFCKERRAQLKQDRPDLPFGQLGKRLGEMWRSMSNEEKKHYEDRATGDRDRYKGEMSSYQSTAMMKGAQREHGGGGGGGEGRSGGGGGGGGGNHRSEEEGDSPVRRKGDSNGGDKKAKTDDYHAYHKHDSSPGE